jgi:hypothetical protein
MKKTTLLLFFILIVINIFAQKWEKTIGVPNLSEYSQRAIEHYDKGYIITSSFTGGYNDHHGWIIKTGINGNLLWDKIIGVDPDEVLLQKTVYDSYGNLYLFGTIIQGIEPLWPVAVKLDACGELQWCRQLYFEEYEFGQFYDAILLENGDLLAVANMPDDDQHDMIFLFCISPEGEYKWKKSYASCTNYPNFEMRLGSRIQFFDDIYIISGYVYTPHPNFPTISSIRPMFIGIDTAFNEQWVLVFGMEDNMKGKAWTSIQINDTLFMGTGRYRYYGNAGETKDAWGMIYNDKGEQVSSVVISKDQLGSESIESVFYEVERINDSLYLSTAGFYSPEEEEYSTGEIVFDTSGRVYNFETGRLEGSPASTFLAKTYDSKYVVATSILYPNLTWDVYFYKINQNLEQDTVYLGNYTYDSLCTELPIQSGVIDLTGCDVITSVEEIPTLEEYNEKLQSIPIKASPNPTNTGEVLLEMENTGLYTNMHLKVFDVYGKQIHSEKVYPHQGATRLDVSSWLGGMYIVTIYSNGQVRGKCKVVVE